MATRAEILQALRAADAAGDQEGAARLAAMYDAAPPDAPEGEVGWMTPVDDTMRVVADSATRGFLDKGLDALPGEKDAQAHTGRSRERLNDVVEAGADIGGALLASPYRIGSMAAGAGWGALEGAASEYGHQENWVPSWEDAKKIALAGGENAVLGAGGAKLGEWAGKGWSKLFPEAPVHGPPTAPSDPKLSKIGTAVHTVAKQPLSVTVPIDVGLAHFGITPVATGGARIAKKVAPAFQPQITPGALPVQPESEATAALRDYFSRMLAGYGRSP